MGGGRRCSSPAYLVKFEVPGRPLPFDFIKPEDVYVLRHGINFLPPEHKRRYSLNTYPKLPKDEVTVDVTYFAKGEAGNRLPRRDSFTLRPLEFEGYGEWQDREREAHIATKTGMDSLRKAMDAFYRGRITLTAVPGDQSRTNSSEHDRSPEDMEKAWKSLADDWEPRDGPNPFDKVNAFCQEDRRDGC